ncbi:MAG TPA: class I SAM-dependent methyltransferase [Mucilaginibacter sp.]|nr:class I SAM-dependent methyltransferase [Mucilaginibacter sp.]
MFKRYLDKLKPETGKELDKHASETKFWKDELQRYNDWYDGSVKEMYNTSAPSENEKVVEHLKSHSSILTWHKLHQEVKYLNDLNLNKNAFAGKKVLDVGCGPMPSATCFKEADIYCLDPLLDRYIGVGFPLHLYGDVKFVQGYSENMPVNDGFFDVVLSVNALDHVDDFELTAKEIKRVLKPGGWVVLHLHYHPPTQNEPLELNDERVAKAFADIRNFRKLSESQEKFGYQCDEGESYALWSNMSS